MTLSHPASQSTPASSSTATAKLIPSSAESLTKAGERIRAGDLVSFPTETVYGLGCHALDPIAVKKVFQAKERPLTDPLIVHVNDASSALNLWDASSSNSSTSINSSLEKQTLEALASNFWPGPLTIVARASPKVPSIIMANTGFVACRSPSHSIARLLIEKSQVPIAAPSANKFGHVSPTKAMHVFDDLGMEDVWIVDPDYLENGDNSNDADVDTNTKINENKDVNGVVCNVGVESTVAKVELLSSPSDNLSSIVGVISVLRHGAVSSHDIAKCLQKVGLDKYFQVKSKQQATGENVNHVAPGQTIRHYSPNVQSYMISQQTYSNAAADVNGNVNSNDNSSILSQEEINNLRNGVIIDFGGRLNYLKYIALAYRDLSPNGDSSIAAANVFDTLRWSETVDGAQRVYFPEIVAVDNVEHGNVNGDVTNDALILAVKDRLTRAASGVVVTTFI